MRGAESEVSLFYFSNFLVMLYFLLLSVAKNFNSWNSCDSIHERPDLKILIKQS